jgi:hypothetical protein
MQLQPEGTCAAGFGEHTRLAEPLMRYDCLGESDRRHVRVRLQCEEIAEGAQKQAVHGESGCKGGEFVR